tara:strand:- start:197 stop:424 length:228 start_codon:yes stop_codon:yes gene_type:complete
MGKKWKRILRLRRNATQDTAEETPAAAPAKVATKDSESVTEERRATAAEEVAADTPKVSKKSKSSKTTKRTTKSK